MSTNHVESQAPGVYEPCFARLCFANAHACLAAAGALDQLDRAAKRSRPLMKAGDDGSQSGAHGWPFNGVNKARLKHSKAGISHL